MSLAHWSSGACGSARGSLFVLHRGRAARRSGGFNKSADIMLPILETRDIKWAYSESLPSVLAQTKSSLLISTYQTGQLVVVSAPQGQLAVSFHTFERPMGL